MDFLKSGGSAIIIALITGVFAQTISCSVQERLKERDAAIASLQEGLKQEEQIVTGASQLVGDAMGDSEDLISLTSKPFAVSNFSGKEREKVIGQRTEIRDRYDQEDRLWQAQGSEYGIKAVLLTSLYAPGRADVSGGWQGLQLAVTAYKDCAENWYYQHVSAPVEVSDARAACSDKKSQVSANLEKFVNQVETAWQQGETK